MRFWWQMLPIASSGVASPGFSAQSLVSKRLFGMNIISLTVFRRRGRSFREETLQL